MIMSPFCSLVIQNGGSLLTSSSGTRARTGDMDPRNGVSDRSIEGARRQEEIFYGFVRVDLWAIFLEDSMVLKYCKWKKN